jgi:hypothetical protein
LEKANSLEQLSRVRERLVDLCRIFAAATGAVGFPSAFTANDRRNLLD